MNAQARRMLPWAVLALTTGLMTGWSYGGAREDAPAVPAATPGAATPAVTPSVAATLVPPVPVSPAPEAARLACLGERPSPSGPFAGVAGLIDLGAEELAKAANVTAIAKPFAELKDSTTAQDDLEKQALEAAQKGPLILLLKKGPYQERLAQQVARASADSVVVVVAGAPHHRAQLTGFPAGAVLVAPPDASGGPATQTWSSAVLDIVTGKLPCNGG